MRVADRISNEWRDGQCGAVTRPAVTAGDSGKKVSKLIPDHEFKTKLDINVHITPLLDSDILVGSHR
jgi:hypothetical protein